MAADWDPETLEGDAAAALVATLVETLEAEAMAATVRVEQLERAIQAAGMVAAGAAMAEVATTAAVVGAVTLGREVGPKAEVPLEAATEV